jgi:hypothetical protein
MHSRQDEARYSRRIGRPRADNTSMVPRAHHRIVTAHRVARATGMALYRRMSRDLHLHRTAVDVLDYEIVQEQASALGRMGRALEAALAALRAFDAAHQHASAPARTQQARRKLVIEAGHALWMFVVQREACGLRDSRAVMRDYKVPGEVQQCMGLAPTPSLRAATA